MAAGPDAVAPPHPPRPPIPIVALDEGARAAALAVQARAAEAGRALGRLGDLAVWLAAVTGDARPQLRARVVVAAADHGVAAHDTEPSRSPDTGQMLRAPAAGGAALAALAHAAGADVVLVDAGLRGGSDRVDCVRAGIGPSRDLTSDAALSVGEVAAAVDCGRDLAAAAAADGVTVLAGGAPGVGATIPATCLAAALTGADAAAAEAEREVVRAAVALHAPAARGPLGLLRRLGGGDVAVLCGVALGAGEHGLGFVCDGLVATAAAAVAVAVEPDLRPRLLAGHRSPEPAHDALLTHLWLDPILDLGMRLGDGSGATAAIALLGLAAAAHDAMSSPAPGRNPRPPSQRGQTP